MQALWEGDPVELGGYRIVGRLGIGGMGTVYLGRDRGGRRAAVKVVHADLADDPAFRARFAREVATAGRQRPVDGRRARGRPYHAVVELDLNIC